MCTHRTYYKSLLQISSLKSPPFSIAVESRENLQKGEPLANPDAFSVLPSSNCQDKMLVRIHVIVFLLTFDLG